jgi:hypothetical protein
VECDQEGLRRLPRRRRLTGEAEEDKSAAATVAALEEAWKPRANLEQCFGPARRRNEATADEANRTWKTPGDEGLASSRSSESQKKNDRMDPTEEAEKHGKKKGVVTQISPAMRGEEGEKERRDEKRECT